MKVVLVNPDIPQPNERPKNVLFDRNTFFPYPIGLLYVAAVLDKSGIDVEVIDNSILQLTSERLTKEVVKKNPSVVGFSLTSYTWPSAKKNMEDLKEALPDVSIVGGGPHATLFPEDTIKNKFVDVIVRGEGEYTFLETVGAIEKNKQLKKVKGIFFKNGDEIRVTEPRPFIKNLDELPWPARHLVDVSKYYRGRNNYLDTQPIDSITSSRGCPFGCKFCSCQTIWGGIYRFRSPKSVADEIEFLIDNYGAKGIIFQEDNFTVNKTRVKGICDEIKKRKLDIIWSCESRVDLISEDIVKEMVSAGCRGIWFGVESGTQKTLDYIKKGITLEESEGAFKTCKKFGVKTGASFMLGLPVETREDIMKTLEFAKKLDADTTWFSGFLGIPGNAIYDEIKRNGWYDFEWEKILVAVRNEHLTHEEIIKMQNFMNAYFRFRRSTVAIKRLRISHIPYYVGRLFEVTREMFVNRL